MAALAPTSLGGTLQSHPGTNACFCRGGRIRQYRRELELLVARQDVQLLTTLSRRSCPGTTWPGTSRNGTAFGARECVVGRLLELILCSHAHLLRRDLAGMLRFRVRANALMPFASPCLASGAWPVSAAEIYDNYANAVLVLGEHVAPDDDEKQGFFKKALSEADWVKRINGKFEEVAEGLRWRSRADRKSGSGKFERTAMYSKAAPADSSRVGGGGDTPCGLHGQPEQGAPETPYSPESTARRLSDSGCVWLLENACIEERSIVLFAGRNTDRGLPKTLLGCGEFGNYEFTAVEVRHPRTRRFMANASDSGGPDTLVVVPGLMSGVSLHNPFHLLHSTVPVTWQLHHPSYGLCIPRGNLDMRLAFFNAHHGKRTAHFWRIFSNPSRSPVTGEDMEQRFNVAATWRFWWGPLSERLPAPLGADSTPRCYRRVVFGRELFRTGRGGFGTPRVVEFYRRYLAEALGSRLPQDAASPAGGSPQPAAGDAEWSIFEHLRPGGPHRDFSNVQELGVKYATSFTPEGAARLEQPPLRMWRADEGSFVAADGTGPSTASGPVSKVESRVVRSQAIPGEAPKHNLQVLVVQRPKGAGRWIANMDDVIRWAEAWSHPRASLSLLIADLGGLHPAAQWQLASRTHILVGVTGAALAWAAFQPRGGVVLDLFPPASNFCTEGWGRNPVSHYGGLSRLSGIQHACMIHPAELQGPVPSGVDPEHQARVEVRERLGGLWHGQDVRLDMAKFRRLFEEGVERALGALALA
uniref:Uncharacterized protein n=1 Tax=Alexandrium monilatum TaxID=311494 RepID=A0A7S4RQ55_9DINO